MQCGARLSLSLAEEFEKIPAKMKTSLVLFAGLLAFAFAADHTEEDDVVVLTDDNLASFVKENNYVLVEFCKYSLNLTT